MQSINLKLMMKEVKDNMEDYFKDIFYVLVKNIQSKVEIHRSIQFQSLVSKML